MNCGERLLGHLQELVLEREPDCAPVGHAAVRRYVARQLGAQDSRQTAVAAGERPELRSKMGSRERDAPFSSVHRSREAPDELLRLPPDAHPGRLGGDASRRRDAACRRDRRADVAVTLEIWPRMIHAWALWNARLEDGRKALERAGEFMRRGGLEAFSARARARELHLREGTAESHGNAANSLRDVSVWGWLTRQAPIDVGVPQ